MFAFKKSYVLSTLAVPILAVLAVFVWPLVTGTTALTGQL